MSTASDDPNAPNANAEAGTTGRPDAEGASGPGAVRTRREVNQLAGKALPYLAALAAAGSAHTSAASPTSEADRAHLEALLNGSWTQPADLSGHPSPADPVADSAQSMGEFDTAASFNDSYNPHPTPYSDRTYADSGFGDRN